jgi:hypothetical protein
VPIVFHKFKFLGYKFGNAGIIPNIGRNGQRKEIEACDFCGYEFR